jgi:hypothetical protein|tara:strand:- start:158 stop:397 length:240 start_codon:yes stop_codon:yes gene_type:complete
MFVNHVVNALNAGNAEEKQVAKKQLGNALVVLAVVLVLLLVVGPWLWNTVVRHLVPGVRAARWYDILGLSVLLSLVVSK